ncbi:MAG: PAS domain S-box protein, partial [Candidatus Tectomicrobia bacterium]
MGYTGARLRGEDTPTHYVYQGIRKDGSMIWLDNMVRVITWQGEPAIQSTVVDITERKHAEEALREQEAQYRTLVEGSIEGISMIDRSGRCLFANDALAEIWGYAQPAELLNQNLRTLFPAPHERDRLLKYRQARMRGEPAPCRYEFQGQKKDGALIWVERLRSDITWHGEPAILVTYIDITERKQAEQERQGLEDQLRQSQKMEAIGTLAGGIAHDLNNMLGAIVGYTELATYDMPPDHPSRANLQHVLTAGNRVKDLVQQILAFSRQSAPQRHPVQLHRIVNDALGLLRASLPTTIEIRQTLGRDTETILADATQLHQVMMNLCVNAEHAMRDTGGTLDIRVETVDVDVALATVHPALHLCPHVQLTIQDTGHGMTPEVLKRIFDPYYTTKKVGEGTGLGLSVVHGIVANHDGVITVQSRPGAGTTFAMYFPRIDPPQTADRPPSEDAAIPQGHGRILFVDDEEALVYLGQAMLERLGYEVVTRSNSLEALEAFR